MTTKTQESRALAALGHDARLAVFRLLVQTGGEGLRVGDIAQQLELAPSTLAHHLTALVDSGLVVQEKVGREVFNKADYQVVLNLSQFLLSGCCQGVPQSQKEDAA
ncbi:MAG: metalloregulator ArsR/SmtB family transcription factor [Rhodobacteraceae bacterium]|nr:metalloregulator ArsR/SmtB family transcription factor [Paracoccaceae bacterium]